MTVCIVYFFVPVLRDIEDRGRDLEQVLTQYITFVKPAFEEFCLPVSLLPLSVPLYRPPVSCLLLVRCSFYFVYVVIYLLFLDKEICRCHYPPWSRQSW